MTVRRLLPARDGHRDVTVVDYEVESMERRLNEEEKRSPQRLQRVTATRDDPPGPYGDGAIRL